MSVLEDNPYRRNYYRFVGSYQGIGPDSDLLEVFEREMSRTVSERDVLEVNVSDHDFYSVFKVVDAQNAPLLIESGLPDGNAVVEFLHRYHLTHLIRDNRRLVAKAKRRRLSPGVFYDIYTTANRNRCSTDEALSAIDLYAECRSLPFVRRHLVPLIIEKSVQYGDAKTVGFKTVESSPNQSLLVAALKAVKTDPDTSVEHIRTILMTWDSSELDHRSDRYAPHSESRNMTESDRFRLLKKVGGEVASGLLNPVYLTRFIEAGMTKDLGRDELIRLYIYVDRVRSGTGRKDEIPMERITAMMRAGVPAESLGEGIKEGWSDERIMALNEGIAPPLTDGWL